MMYVERAHLVVPIGKELEIHTLAASPQVHDKLEVYSGTKAIEQYGITVEGSGSSASGSIKGTITTYDYKAAYDVYNIPYSESANYWFVSYKKDTSQGELKKTFEQSKTVPLDYNINFTIHGNDWGQASVFITMQVIRMVMNGETRDFVVANSASTGANNPDGSKYQGGFEPQ